MPTFDEAYYERYYYDPDTRAVKPSEARRQGAFIAAYLRYLKVPVRRIVDVGCGVGLVLRALEKEFPKATVQGVEWSEHLCAKHGWQPGSVVDFPGQPSGSQYDLVVCNDVLAYLDDKAARRAIKNLAQRCRGVLFLGVLTEDDLDVMDAERTDPEQLLRPASWYRRALARHFVSIGGGLHLKRGADIPVWAMERGA